MVLQLQQMCSVVYPDDYHYLVQIPNIKLVWRKFNVVFHHLNVLMRLYSGEFYEGNFVKLIFIFNKKNILLEQNQKMVGDYYVKNLKKSVLIYQLDDVKQRLLLY
jgi:hypothetical protein